MKSKCNKDGFVLTH